jgi:hypothetical protein
MKNKYGNRKIEYNGEKYDSVKEYRRHDELKLLERAGKISGLQRQVKFELIPAQKIGGKVVERACTYVADFVYTENGATVVEDVKGYKGGGAYAIFTIKRKLMLHVHGIRIKEI